MHRSFVFILVAWESVVLPWEAHQAGDFFFFNALSLGQRLPSFSSMCSIVRRVEIRTTMKGSRLGRRKPSKPIF